jgi:hypothetical protein
VDVKPVGISVLCAWAIPSDAIKRTLAQLDPNSSNFHEIWLAYRKRLDLAASYISRSYLQDRARGSRNTKQKGYYE